MAYDFSHEAIKIFKALSDPTRYEMVKMLFDCDELGCVEFERAFDLSRPAMSHHYRVLENAGLVASRKRGLRVYYRLEKDRLNRFLPGFFQVHCGGGWEADA
jgi:DNA-binding transcriptional ArsR family regulator